MNTEALFLFLILLLGLLLCSFLGGNCKEGLVSSGTVYTGPNSATATVTTNSDGTQSIELVDGSQNLILTQGSTSGAFTNPFGWSASISPSGQNINFQPPSGGATIQFTSSSSGSSSAGSSSSGSSSSSSGSSSGSGGTVYTGPNGATATVTTNTDGTQSIKIVDGSQDLILTQNTPGGTFTNPFGWSATISSGGILVQPPNNGNPISFNTSSSSSSSTSSGSIAAGTVFNGPNGATATLTTNSNGTQTIQLTSSSGQTLATFTQSGSGNLFTSTTGTTATVADGKIVFTDPDGTTITFYSMSGTQTMPTLSALTNLVPNNGRPLPGSTTQSTSNIGSTISNFLSSFDNYNHYSGTATSAQLQNGMVFTDSSGNNVTVNVTSNGTYNLQVASNNSSTPLILNSVQSSSSSSGTPTTFKAPYGGITGNVITTKNGQPAIKITLSNGQSLIFYQPSGSSSSGSNLTNTQYYGSTGLYYQPNNSGYQSSYSYPSQQYYPPPPYYPPSNNYYGSKSSNSTYGSRYYSALPYGIPASQIPEGDEDLYILKSEVVPPVCPACPKSSACPKKEKCPPCPACARCPEPSFECKKVPNYNSINNDYLPQPVLSDFSQFGM